MSDQPDELLQRYADAVAQDARRPSDRVRAAIRAHAQMQLAQPAAASVEAVKPRQPAANQSKWAMSLAASVAVIALTGILVIQIDHGSPEDHEVAFGGPTPSKPIPAAAPDANQAPAVASVAAPAPKTIDAPPPPTPTVAAKQVPPAAERQVAEVQSARAKAGPAQTDKSLAKPVIVAREAVPFAAPIASQVDAAQSLAKSDYNTADSLGNSPTPRDSKALASAEASATTARMAVRPMPGTPAPAVVAAAAPPPAMVSPAPPAPSAAPGLLRQRADAQAYAPVETRFLVAVRNGRISALDALLAQGVSINTRDEAGNTALMIALEERQVAVARRLLERGADTNLVNREGVNALQVAVRMDLPEIVKLLQQSNK